ncbi:hypothetical protein PFH44_04160 [Raoultella sp. Ech2A]|uniref:hypothetical protein n=1 Tax=Raoultella sp. Ech2A TaxID=2996539 RepID=UPI0024C0D9CE|nr:hypothetical protein [Raoultella sp. Ech2A]MDJ1652699.1 hypothetical protein [Raoultella sp. Ech2A]
MKIIHSLKTIFAGAKNKHATGIELIKQRHKICYLNTLTIKEATHYLVFKGFL